MREGRPPGHLCGLLRAPGIFWPVVTPRHVKARSRRLWMSSPTRSSEVSLCASKTTYITHVQRTTVSAHCRAESCGESVPAAFDGNYELSGGSRRFRKVSCSEPALVLGVRRVASTASLHRQPLAIQHFQTAQPGYTKCRRSDYLTAVDTVQTPP